MLRNNTPVVFLSMTPLNDNQYELLIRSVLINPSIERILGEPVEGYVSLKALLAATLNDLRISDIGKFVSSQGGSWEQPMLKNRWNVINAR
jgi:hypothetical protein